MKIVALAGGVGGAKLVYGLSQCLAPGDLTVVVNTADDFQHLGFHISPDLDTVCYTLAGIASSRTGWGRTAESWNVFTNLEKLGGPTWFRLGDKDLATHIERTRRLNQGQTLSEITHEFCKAWGIAHTVLPMTDQKVMTVVKTEEGSLDFQEYFVHRQCQPRVLGFEYRNSDQASPAPGVVQALSCADAVIICPSNPWVSIGPIYSLPDLNRIIDPAKTVAVSPIIRGKAVKGPVAKMYAELGITPSAYAVAQHYQHKVSGFVMDRQDAGLELLVRNLGMQVLLTRTLMRTLEERKLLAGIVLDFIQAICK